jgi:hypothetical protein
MGPSRSLTPLLLLASLLCMLSSPVGSQAQPGIKPGVSGNASAAGPSLAGGPLPAPRRQATTLGRGSTSMEPPYDTEPERPRTESKGRSDSHLGAYVGVTLLAALLACLAVTFITIAAKKKAAKKKPYGDSVWQRSVCNSKVSGGGEQGEKEPQSLSSLLVAATADLSSIWGNSSRAVDSSAHGQLKATSKDDIKSGVVCYSQPLLMCEEPFFVSCGCSARAGFVVAVA